MPLPISKETLAEQIHVLLKQNFLPQAKLLRLLIKECLEQVDCNICEECENAVRVISECGLCEECQEEENERCRKEIAFQDSLR